MKTNIEKIKQMKETISTPGWKHFEELFNEQLEEHNYITNTEHDDISKLIYSQASIRIIKDIYETIEAINREINQEIKLIKKYKKGV